MLKLNRHIPPHDRKTSEKNIRFAELDIPQALATFRPNLSAISASIHPDQEMVNWVNKQRAIASSKDPPFVPYLIPNLTEAPWLPPTTDHSAARTSWIDFSKQARRTTSPQELNIQSFDLYQIRFLFAADLCKAFDSFGGLAPQLAHLSIVLNLSITDSVGVALAYRRVVSTRLQEKARQRPAKLSDFTELFRTEDFTLKEQARREIATAVEKDKRDTLATREARRRNFPKTSFPKDAPQQRTRPRPPRQPFQRQPYRAPPNVQNNIQNNRFRATQAPPNRNTPQHQRR